MSRITVKVLLILLIGFFNSQIFAEDRIELETTFIKGNKEMPQIIYVVPWKDTKDEVRQEQRLVLHSLFGDLFDPVYLDVRNTQ